MVYFQELLTLKPLIQMVGSTRHQTGYVSFLRSGLHTFPPLSFYRSTTLKKVPRNPVFLAQAHKKNPQLTILRHPGYLGPLPKSRRSVYFLFSVSFFVFNSRMPSSSELVLSSSLSDSPIIAERSSTSVASSSYLSLIS